MFEINGIYWDVKFVHPSSRELMRSDGTRTVGVTDWNKKTVFLSNMLRGPFLRKVYIHEVCHCAIFSYSINMDIEQEEFLCDWVATYGDEVFDIVDGVFSVLKKWA